MSSFTNKKIISTENAPKPIAPYNQAIIANNLVFLSGVIGLDKDTKKLVEGGIANETKKALENMREILKAANSSFPKVLKVTILLKNMDDFPIINDIYKEYFTEYQPARTAYQVAKLPLDANIEIEAIAATGNVIIFSKL